MEGNCAHVENLVGGPVTAKLTSSNPGGDNGWFVDWARITMSTGVVFSCPMRAWLDRNGPSLKVDCHISGEHVSSIAIKTGTVPNAQSDCRAVMELCDRQRNCCQTTPNGQGLDNPGNDRESAQTDIYTNRALLGNCAHAGNLVGGPVTAKLTSSNPGGDNGWFVDWARITMSTGVVFSCPMRAWLDRNGPSLKVDCHISGQHVSSIAIKTGTVPNAQSDCRAVMELCDRQRNCCQTTPNGQGLDNPGNDRESGQTDIYTNRAVLGNCAHAGNLVGGQTDIYT